MAKQARSRRRTRMSAGARRELILEQAKRLFATRGYASTSIDDIATAAGVTKPVVYDHFTSKRELYVALMRRLRDAVLNQAVTSLAAEATPRERFHAAIENYFVLMKRDPAIVQLLFVQPRNQPELLHEWERLQDEAMANLEPLIRSLAPRLLPWQLTVAVHFLHHGLNATPEVWPKGASVKKMTELVVGLLWQGLESVS